MYKYFHFTAGQSSAIALYENTLCTITLVQRAGERSRVLRKGGWKWSQQLKVTGTGWCSVAKHANGPRLSGASSVCTSGLASVRVCLVLRKRIGSLQVPSTQPPTTRRWSIPPLALSSTRSFSCHWAKSMIMRWHKSFEKASSS